MVTISGRAIAEDKCLQREGARAEGELAALRWHWCEEKGMTQRTYAKAVGVTQQAVQKSIELHRARHPELVTTQVVTTTSPKQAAAKRREATKRESKRGTPEQVEWRERWVRKLYNENFNRDAISDALNVSHGTVDADLKASVKGRRRWGARVDLEPGSIDWRGGPPASMTNARKTKPAKVPVVVDDEDGYRDSEALLYIEEFLQRCEDRRVHAAFASNYDDALAAHDRAWTKSAECSVRKLAEYANYLVLILDDSEYRKQRQTGNNDLKPRRQSLRSVG